MKIKGGLFLVSALFIALPAVADDLKDDLVAKEKFAWQAWVDGDGEAYRNLLTEDAVFVVAGAGITTGREAVVADVNNNNCEIENLEFSDFKLRKLSPDIAVLTYNATSDTTCEGQRLPSAVYSTTVYVRQEGEWRTTSYQETALE